MTTLCNEFGTKRHLHLYSLTQKRGIKIITSQEFHLGQPKLYLFSEVLISKAFSLLFNPHQHDVDWVLHHELYSELRTREKYRRLQNNARKLYSGSITLP